MTIYNDVDIIVSYIVTIAGPLIRVNQGRT